MALSLRVMLPSSAGVSSKTVRLDPYMVVSEACRVIREHVPSSSLAKAEDYGLFLHDISDDPKKGLWLESERPLGFYQLNSASQVEYRKKMRPLKVKMMDGALRTIMVDDSKLVKDLLKDIGERIGITNWETYSLVEEVEEEDRSKMMPTKDRARDFKKMETLRKMLHTEDGLQWVVHDKTLREQGIDETSVLTLRLRFWDSSNIDRNDPVQLSLLYAEARDAIIQGTHPVSEEEAIKFAALQAQEQYGAYDQGKSKVAASHVKELLPKEYHRVKNIEGRVIQAYSRLLGLGELKARYRYVDLFRSLKTFGVSFFLVKEKVKDKHKLVPRLLGISRDAVMRVDEKTKEVLQEWSLTKVQRWAASPKSFTLDFGDYADVYYSVQTTEGETMSKLIAGYIDIILKKREQSDRPLPPDLIADEVIGVDSINPQHAVITNFADHDPSHGRLDHRSSTGYMLSPDGEALSTSIHNAILAIGPIIDNLQKPGELPPLPSGQSAAEWRENQMLLQQQNVTAQVGFVTSNIAQTVLLTTGDPTTVDYTALAPTVSGLVSSVGEMARGMALLAGLFDDQNTSKEFLQAARDLAASTRGLLTAALPENHADRKQMFEAAKAVGNASGNVMSLLGESEADREFREAIMELTEKVVRAVQDLVQQTAPIVSTCVHPQRKSELVHNAQNISTASTQLVTSSSVLASTLSSPLSQNQLLEAARMVSEALQGVMGSVKNAGTDRESEEQVVRAEAAVSEAVNNLMGKLHEGPSILKAGNSRDQACEAILVAVEKLHASNTYADMLSQTRVLAQGASFLINTLKHEAEGLTDPSSRDQLLQGVRLLAEATSRVAEAARAVSANPSDEEAQRLLKKAADEFRGAMSVAAADAMRRRVVGQLQMAAKHCAASCTRLMCAAQAASATNIDLRGQEQVNAAGQKTTETIGALLLAIRRSVASPNSSAAQLALINASAELLAPGSKLVTASRAVVPSVGDKPSAVLLSNSAKAAEHSLTDLRAAIGKAVEACGSLELDTSFDVVRALVKEVAATMDVIRAGQLGIPHGETLETSAAELVAATKTVSVAMAQLVVAAAKGDPDEAGSSARDLANALRVLTTAGRNLAGTYSDRRVQEEVMASVQNVLEAGSALISLSKEVVNDVTPEGKKRLAAGTRAVQEALAELLNCLPAARAVDAVLQAIAASTDRLGNLSPFRTASSFQELQLALSEKAAMLNSSVSGLLVGARGGGSMLINAARTLSSNFEAMMEAALAMAAAMTDPADQAELIRCSKSVSTAASRLMLSSKSVVTDVPGSSPTSDLANAARDVSDAISALLLSCESSVPGQKDCDKAHQAVQEAGKCLDSLQAPPKGTTFFSCQEAIHQSAAPLSEAVSGISAMLKSNAPDHVGSNARDVADYITTAVQAAADAAYLIGVSQSGSSSRTGVDARVFIAARDVVERACQVFEDPTCACQDVLTQATEITRQTSALCMACKEASSACGDPHDRARFVESAKIIAAHNASLVRSVKVLAADPNEQSRRMCMDASKPLLASLDELVNFANSASPVEFSPEAQQQMQPIIFAGRGLVTSSSALLLVAKTLCADPNDRPNLNLLGSHIKGVTDSLRRLLEGVTLSAPGQRECDEAIEQMMMQSNTLEQATLAAISNTLRPQGPSIEGHYQSVLTALSMLAEMAEAVSVVAKTDPIKLGEVVTALASHFSPMVESTVGAASRSDQGGRMELLNQAKTVADTMLELVQTAKRAGGNPNAVHAHADVDITSTAALDAIHALSSTIENASSASLAVKTFVEAIRQSARLVEMPATTQPTESFQVFQGRILLSCQQIAKIVQDLVTHSSDLGKLMPLMKEVTDAFGRLAKDAQLAIAATDQEDVKANIQRETLTLAQGTSKLLLGLSAFANEPSNAGLRQGLVGAARLVTTEVSKLVSSLKEGSRGIQACDAARNELENISVDLETTALFAQSGSLTSMEPDDHIGKHRDAILQVAKSLMQDTRTLVISATGSQDKLASAANETLATAQRLADATKLGAAAFGPEDKSAQMMLLEATKHVTVTLADLMLAAKNASGKSANQPEMEELRTAAQLMASSASSFVKKFRMLEDEAAKGVRALAAAMEAIQEQVEILRSSVPPVRTATAEDVIQATKGITSATTSAVSACNASRQDEVMAAAALAQRVAVDLLTTCKGAAATAETPEVRDDLLAAGQHCAESLQAILNHVVLMIEQPSADRKQQLPVLSKTVADSVSGVVVAAQALKGAGWVDPNDPNVIAEEELLSAAAAIEAASKKLAALKPRHSAARAADMNLSFDEQIIEAAKAITNATSALVRSATVTQRELVAEGRVTTTGSTYLRDEDGQWSKGLVSAAQLVAASATQLCEAASQLVQGKATEYKLIAAANGVAASNTQLLMACLVKANRESESAKRLQEANQAVTNATDSLVAAAQNAADHDLQGTEEALAQPKPGSSGVSRVILEMEKRTRILELEKQLSKAREDLGTQRSNVYKQNKR